MRDVFIYMILFFLSYGVSGAAMNAQVCQEAVNKGYALDHCWFNQKPN